MRLLALFFLSTFVLHPQEQEYKLTAQANLVILDVGVRENSGGLAGNLEKDNFRVFENGKQQTIVDFNRGDEPVTVGLVIDNSGSMRSKRNAVNRAAMGFLDGSNPRDEVFITHFNDSVRRSLPETTLFSDDRNLLVKSLARDPSRGRTALYDAVISSLHQLEQGKQTRKSLLVVSDGGDNASDKRLNDVIEALRGSFATIYAIGVYDNDDPDRNPAVLRRLAEISGGEAYFPKELDDVQDICGRIAKDLRNRYTITYVPSEASANRVRRIRVEVANSSHSKFVVHARTSYVFPDKARP